jgi:hypothetical protein
MLLMAASASARSWSFTMSSTKCFDDVGCEAFILMDRREDGTEHYFVRKICKGLDGVRITYDLELDGQTPYTPLGEVLPVQTGSGDCSATVFIKDFFDLAPEGQVILDETDNEKFCATPFLRHFVYDCDGKVKEVYDTGFDGEPYTPVSVSEALSGSIPSVKNVIWPSIRHELHPDDGGENKRFLLPVTHPKTGATGYVDFQSATASNPTASGGCNYAGENVSVNAPISGGNWRSKPSENSRFTFRPDNVVKQMSMLRLEFRDLDVFEGVWGLTPWPDAIVDRNGSKETIETDDAPNIRAIHSLIPDNVVYAYYFKIPDEITHLYRNAGGGTACHAARFTGYTIEPGPCCSGCVEEEEEVEEVVVDYKCPELLTTGMKTLREDDAVVALPMTGFDLISVSVDSLRGETTVTTMDGTGTLR